MPSRRATVVAAAALAPAGLTGCAGGDSTDAVARGDVVRVELREYRVDPQDWQARAGRIELVAANHGRLPHDLVVERARRDIGQEVKELARMRPVLPGGTGRTSVRLRPGTYRLSSNLNHNDNLGMYGTLRVVAR